MHKALRDWASASFSNISLYSPCLSLYITILPNIHRPPPLPCTCTSQLVVLRFFCTNMLSCRMHNYSHHFVFYKRKVSSEKGYFYRLGRAKISAGKDAGLRKPPSHLLCHSLLHKGIFSLTENSYLRQMRHSHHFSFSHVKQRLHCPQWISPPLDKKISLCRP